MSVIVAATARPAGQDDPYTSVSEAPAWAALERLDRVHPRFAHAVLREACGLPPLAHGPKLAAWLAQADAASVLELDLRRAPHLVLDLGIGSPFLGADPRNVETEELTRRIFGAMAEAGAAFGVGRYARDARDLPLAALRPGRARDRRAPHACTSGSTSSSSRVPWCGRRSRASSTCSRTTGSRRTTGRS